MASFQHIEYLFGLLIILPLLLLFYSCLQHKTKVKKALGDSLLIDQLTANYSPHRFRLKFLIVSGVLFLLIFTSANLHQPIPGENEKGSGIDIMIALDISKSMWCEDLKPSRLERSKQLINTIIDNAGNNRIGLVVFAGKAYLQMPLTSDIASAKIFAANASPDNISVQGTNISAALQLCRNSLDTKEKKYKSVILISDGEDHDPDAAQTILELSDEGVIVNTVGIGTTAGAPIMEPGSNAWKMDNNGVTVISKLNEQELMNIASATGGIYHHFINADEAADALFNTLDGMEKKLIQGSFGSKQYATFYPWFLIPAILFLGFEIFIPEIKRKRKEIN